MDGLMPDAIALQKFIAGCWQAVTQQQSSLMATALEALLLPPSVHGLSLSLTAEPYWKAETGRIEGEPVLRAVIRSKEDIGELRVYGLGILEGWATPVVDIITLCASAARSQRQAAHLEDRFQTLNRNQNDFIRIVSHDLRSPLTYIRGFAEMLDLGVGGDLTSSQRQFTEKIMSGITQMTMLVENIQDAGRFDPETGFYEMSRSPVDVGEIVSHIVHEHLMPAEKEALSISVWMADDLPIIYADGNMLERAITNLVDNAIKYTPNGGRIEVNVTRQQHPERGYYFLRVSVKDNGLGITPEEQKQLFQRHVRLVREEQKRIKGTGLGLFIVRSVAQHHLGEAWVESEPGEGSTFSFSIPLMGANLIGGE